MSMTFRLAVVAAVALVGSAPASAQQPRAAPTARAGNAGAVAIPVGAVAPDFALTGATRYGLLRAPVRLSDYRGQTVVLAFFPQARTKG